MGVGVIASQPHKGHINAIARALDKRDNRYPLDAKIRKEMVEEAYTLATKSTSERVRVAALRVLAALDQVNVRREANEIEETGQQRQEQTARLRAALATPEGRQAMADATQAMLGTKPVETPMNPPISEPIPLEPNEPITPDYASFGGSE